MGGINFQAFGKTPELRLSKAILLYESGRRGELGYHGTVHPVDHSDATGPVVMPGTLLTREALEDAVVRLSSTAELRSWSFVDASVLASGSDMCVWFTPPGVKHMVFASSGLPQAGPASQPGMLWLAWRRALWVFALKEFSDRPKLSDPVFHSPHFNVWKGGRVCLGSMPVPNRMTPQAWVSSFYGSEFSHPNDGATWQAKFRGGIPALWRKLLKEGGRKPFPTEALVHTGATIEQIVEAVMSTGVKQVGGGA